MEDTTVGARVDETDIGVRVGRLLVCHGPSIREVRGTIGR